jgi:hypothetical protein
MGFAQLVVLTVFLNGINELSFVIQTGSALFDARTEILCNTGAVRKVSGHFEYLENRSPGFDVIWQPVRRDLTVYP